MSPNRPRMESLDEDILDCDLCHQRYNHYSRRPKLLICHHSYCLKCLQKLQTEFKVVVCIACQKNTKIGPTGVTALPDNNFVLERLDKVPEEDEIVTNTDEIISPMNGQHPAFATLVPKHFLGVKPEKFCKVCQRSVSSSCAQLHPHEIKSYDLSIHSMELEFAKEKKDAMDTLEKLIENAQQLSTLNAFIQDAWEALKIVLDHNQKEYDNKIKEAQQLMYNLKINNTGVEEARAGNPDNLQRAINESKEINQDLSYKNRNLEESIAQWRVVTNCTAKIMLHEVNPLFPLNNFDITLDLHDPSQSSECICLMFALSRYVEKRLQTKRMDNLVGNLNAWGSHTLNDITQDNTTQPAFNINPSTSVNGEVTKSESSFQLQVVDNKPKTTIAQIVKTKTPTPLPPAPAAPLRIITMKRNYMPVVNCYFDLTCDGVGVGRIVMEVYYKEAPIMARNFIELCTGIHGFGYKYSDLWNVADNDHVVGGQLREGEVSIYDRKPFGGDASKLHDGVGMLRMRGHSTANDGRAVVSSQFMIWMKPKAFKTYARTLVIGKVVRGMDILAAVPTMNGKSLPKKSPFKISDCGIQA